ncbi:uncharacterized protein DS421_20g676270 [Arachis hypogaea]|nr:uncharacterized protein DS421_20g676270 [Arachis hypogaea]
MSLDHEATLAETFKYTHTLKVNKKRFVDERSVAHYEEYHHRLEAATQQSQLPSGADKANSETSVVDPNKIWCETTSEPHKNCRFGLGSFFASGLCSFTLADSSASAFATNPADPHEVIDLREEMEEYSQQMCVGGNGAASGAPTAAPTPPPQQGDHDAAAFDNDDNNYQDP